MIWDLVVVEHAKLFRRQLTWVVIGLITAMTFIVSLAQYLIAKNPPAGADGAGFTPEMIQETLASVTWPGAFQTILGEVSGLGWLVAIVLFGAVFSQEYTWRTLQLWLTRGVPRGSLIFAKVAVLPLPILAVGAVPLVVVGALAAALTLLSNGSLDIVQVDPLGLALGLAATCWALLPYAAVTLPLAVASRSTVAPIGGGVAFLILEKVIVGTGLAIAPYMPSSLAASLTTLNVGIVRGAAVQQAAASSGGVSPLDPPAAALGIAIWALTFAGIAYGIFRRQDVAE